jgi:hypothetical protein
MTDSVFQIFVLAGISCVVVAIIFAASLYIGKQGERFSFLNHFISELGEVGGSRAAHIFNASLIAAGILIIPFLVSLGYKLDSVVGWIAVVSGTITAMGVSAVGIFPMNNLKPHIIAAMTYFRAGFLMVFFFGLAILFQPNWRTEIPKYSLVLNLLAFLAYGIFLVYPMLRKEYQSPSDVLDPSEATERPRFWAIALLEWGVFFSTIIWLLGMAIII